MAHLFCWVAMNKCRVFSLYFMILLASFFPGCSHPEEVKKIDLSKREAVKESTGGEERIKIGLVPEQDIRKMASRFEPLAEYLNKKLGAKVTLIYLDSYAEVCDKFIYKQLDAAFFGSFSYALTHAKAGVEPLARPDYSGTSTYRGLIIVRQEGKINSTADMQGRRLALVHRATYAGYLFPLYYFNKQGIKDLNEYFSEITFAGGHDKSIFMLLRGEADIAAPKDLVYQRVIKENPNLEKQLVILAVSGPVPSNALCVSKDFKPALKEKLKAILLNLDKYPDSAPVLAALGASRFIETKDEDYQYLYETIKALGIDLNTYPYYERPDIGFKKE
ncbi:MAG: phosphate/phosphite/phosphonate ABC transporter substrate-binding protein [Candidatus Omnitrophota bacterium]